MRPFDYFVLFLTPVLLLGCGKSPAPKVDGAPGTVTSVDDSPAEPNPTITMENGLRPDAAYPVPNLAPEELLRFINQLAVQVPRGDTQEEFTSDQMSRARSRLIAADRIMGSPDTNSALTEAAVKAKLDALRVLAMLSPQGLGIHFQPYCEALKNGDSARFALLARVSEFEYELDRLSLGKIQTPDLVLARLKDILNDQGAEHAEFLITQYAGEVLGQSGYADEATQVLNLVGNHFAQSTNQEVAEEAKELLEKTAFREKVILALNGGERELRSLSSAIHDLLREKDKLTLETLDTTLNAGQMLEYSGKLADAKAVFAAIKEAFVATDPRLAEQASRSAQYAEKRIGLIGQKIEIQGVHTDGTAFDWGKHRGKVILVDFWATWSVPWLDELQNIKATFDRFHDDGFEIVGVNLDESKDQVYEFLRQHPLPWVTVVDEAVGGFGNPNAIRYGVEAVPFVMLVGRDGRVANIHVHGAELSRQVQQLLSTPISQNRNDAAVLK